MNRSGGNRVHCGAVYSPAGLARNLTKDMTGFQSYGWNRRVCRLVWHSHGFLTKKKETLWAEQVAEWYGPKQNLNRDRHEGGQQPVGDAPHRPGPDVELVPVAE